MNNFIRLLIVTINDINSDYFKENKLHAIINDTW